MKRKHGARRVAVAAVLSVALSGCADSGGAETDGTMLAGGSAGAAGAGAGGAHAGSTAGGAAGSAAIAGSGAGGALATGGAGGQGNAAGTGGGTAGSGALAGTSGGAGQSGASGTGAGGGAGGSAGGDAGASGSNAGGSSGTGAGGEAGGQAGSAAGSGGRSISFGTLLDAQVVMHEAQELAAESADPSSPDWRAKGDQHRSYHFAAADSDQPYRISVPDAWDGTSPLPLVMFLHGAGSDENSYLDQNNGQLLALAEQHGYLLVSPLGVAGAYGNFLRLTAPFGDEQGAAELMAQVTPETERVNELSEQDVINVLELVLAEYPVDREAMFLAGHSMGSGGTWYIGGKYASYWRGIGPMSGPFVQESGYPWESLRPIAIFVTEGTQTPSLDASRLLRDWLSQNEFDSEYLEVDSDHGGMIPLVLPDVFDFFDGAR